MQWITRCLLQSIGNMATDMTVEPRKHSPEDQTARPSGRGYGSRLGSFVYRYGGTVLAVAASLWLRHLLHPGLASLSVLAVMVAVASSPADQPAAVSKGTAPATAEATGDIEGAVSYAADPARPWRYGRYYIRDRETRRLAEAVVALAVQVPVPHDPSWEPAETIMDQKDFQFTPETVAIRAGDRVKFTNSDRETHNVRTLHPLHPFNVNMPPRGEHVETFAKASGLRRPYQIGCVYHSAMRAWIFVLDHPYFCVTDTEGRFRIEGVPPARYAIEVVHAAGALRHSESVEVRPGRTSRLDIVVSPDDQVKSAP